MAYYLSQRNKSLLNPFLKRLNDPSKGSVKLETNDTKSLLYILRTAANTDYPTLKEWRFKNKDTYVLAIPKNIVLTNALNNEQQVVEDYLDFLSLLAYIAEHPITDVMFTHVDLSEKDASRLELYCASKGYLLEHTDNGIHIQSAIES